MPGSEGLCSMTLTVGYLVYAKAELLVHVVVTTDLKLGEKKKTKTSTPTDLFLSESLTAV